MQVVPNLWERINYLVTNANCRTFGDDYDLIEWADVRTKPTISQLLSVTDVDLQNRRADDAASNFYSLKKAIIATLDVTFAFVKNPALYSTLADYKQAVRDRYKVLNGS